VSVPGVSFVVVHDIPVSWEQYEAIACALAEPVPDGLVLRVAGRTDEGVRIIDVWESEQAWRWFHSERLVPALAARNEPLRPEPVLRELRPEHVVVGNGRGP
jgi:hypothetical protein